jgi:hypothetical protein
MRTAGVLLALLLSGRQTPANSSSGSMPIPVSLAELATAAGIRNTNPSTLPIDIVRALFAAPERARDQSTAQRAAVVRALESTGNPGGRIPLPLSPRAWRRHVFGADVAEERLAAAIFSRRDTALLYHGLLALDPPTLQWLEAHPNALDALLKHPGITAALARSITVRNGSVVTPGDDANDVWTAIVGADPRDPESFITKLIGSREGRLAVFYDAITHLDTPRRRFALGRAGDPNRIDRLRKLIDVATRDMTGRGLEFYPFMRPDVDMAMLFRQIALDARDVPTGPMPHVWAEVFGETTSDNYRTFDAALLASLILKPGRPGPVGRRDTFVFAQRVFASEALGGGPTMVAALQGFSNYPALMLVLESNGYQTVAAYAEAARAAASLAGDDEAIAVFQGTLAIVDRARQSGTLARAEARAVIDSLVRAASYRPARVARAALLSVLKNGLPLRWNGDTEAALLSALAGKPPAAPALLEWEGQPYSVDLARPELRRLTAVRRSQQEMPLGEAIASATSADMSSLVSSLTGLVYATALGEPDSRAANAGQVWRRHRFGSAAVGASDLAWRLATEEFGGAGWRLTGSLLRLDLALAHLALRRIDPTDMPAESAMSANDRRALARAVALIDPRTLGDDARDAAAAALARGRARVAALAAHPETLDAIAAEAPLSEWRLAGLRWLLVNDAARVPGAFTLLELFRLGGGTSPPGWGTAADPLGGCYCLRMPDRVPWEEYAGRPLSGQLATQLPDVMLRTAEALSARRLPAVLMRDVAAYAMQDTIDSSRQAYYDNWLSLAFAARDIKEERFDDFVAALTASGPMVPVRRNVPR